MKKKVMSVLLSMAMLAAVLAGCGNSAQETAAPETTEEAPAAEEAAAGIKVCSIDSSVNAASRLTHVNQAGTIEIGQCLIDAVYDLTGGEGQWAILSATSQATNQNSWIEAMKTLMEKDEKYSKPELVEIAYGDDEHSCPYMFLWNPIDIGRLGGLYICCAGKG